MCYFYYKVGGYHGNSLIKHPCAHLQGAQTSFLIEGIQLNRDEVCACDDAVGGGGPSELRASALTASDSLGW